jgi:hypothetical protein
MKLPLLLLLLLLLLLSTKLVVQDLLLPLATKIVVQDKFNSRCASPAAVKRGSSASMPHVSKTRNWSVICKCLPTMPSIEHVCPLTQVLC